MALSQRGSLSTSRHYLHPLPVNKIQASAHIHTFTASSVPGVITSCQIFFLYAQFSDKVSVTYRHLGATGQFGGRSRFYRPQNWPGFSGQFNRPGILGQFRGRFTGQFRGQFRGRFRAVADSQASSEADSLEASSEADPDSRCQLVMSQIQMPID